MRKKIKNFLLCLAAMAMVFQPAVINAGVSEAVSYLEAQTQDAWITQALVAAGAANPPISHLAEVSGTLATDYAKAILALSAVGKDSKTFGNIDYAAKLKTYFNNNQIGDAGLLNDDAWAVLALASIKEAGGSEAIAAKNYLLANQNADGGWGYAIGGASDTNDTATAMMALVEAGVSISDSAITNAVLYLQSSQNTDGGFGWMAGHDSDSGSDAWVISALYKIGQNPANWNKGANTPISHLESLQDSDGGFWWVAPGTSDFNNKAMTAYAVIALSGKSFPVGYYEAEGPSGYHLRIEGQNGNICDEYVEATTALDIVENGAVVCGYSYVITSSAYGDYLSQVNDEAAAGMSGWMYFVNNESLMVGAGDYVLESGDEILWYYGDWGWQPTRLSVSDNDLETGESLTITAEYFNGASWLNLAGATVKGGEQNYTTDSAGKIIVNLPDGHYNLYAEKTGFVRSNSEAVDIGEAGAPQAVSLTVEVGQTGSGGDVLGEAIIFDVSPDSLNFGKLNPGESNIHNLAISNSGTVDLSVSAEVSGSQLFKDNLKLNGGAWSNYSDEINADEEKIVETAISIPGGYLDSGVKTGELVFWAVVN